MTMLITADLIDPVDPLMTDTSRPYSPRLPSAGVIGQPSPTLLSRHITSHTRSSPPNSQAELDLAQLIAQAHRQHEVDKARSQNGSSHNGVGVIGDGLNGLTDSLRRLRTEDGWDRRFISGHGDIPSPMPSSLPHSAPLPPSQPLAETKFPAGHPFHRHETPSPFAAFQASTIKADVPIATDPAAQVAHHLLSLSTIFNPLLFQQDEVERLKQEVEMWKEAWGKVEKERKRLEAVMASPSARKPVGPTSTAVLIDGDGLIVEDHHLQNGFAGGQAAARALLSALPKFSVLADASPTSATTNGDVVVDVNAQDDAVSPRDLGSVTVQVFVNKTGLGSTLVKMGSVPSWGVYESFWQGFSASHELFTVIDVGPGKEASDAKIRVMSDQNLQSC